MNEIRNELLLLLSYATKDENKEFYLREILERFQYDIERQLEDLSYKEKELKQNLELVNYVRKELNIKEVK